MSPEWNGSLTQAISIGIERGLTDMGAALSGCTPSMLAMYALRQIKETPGLTEDTPDDCDHGGGPATRCYFCSPDDFV